MDRAVPGKGVAYVLLNCNVQELLHSSWRGMMWSTQNLSFSLLSDFSILFTEMLIFELKSSKNINVY